MDTVATTTRRPPAWRPACTPTPRAACWPPATRASAPRSTSTTGCCPWTPATPTAASSSTPTSSPALARVTFPSNNVFQPKHRPYQSPDPILPNDPFLLDAPDLILFLTFPTFLPRNPFLLILDPIPFRPLISPPPPHDFLPPDDVTQNH